MRTTIVTFTTQGSKALSAASSDDKETNRTGRQECHPYASLRDGAAK